MIPLLCLSLLAVAYLAREPAMPQMTRRRRRALMRERYSINPALRRKA